jgi:hypothetical protein
LQFLIKKEEKIFSFFIYWPFTTLFNSLPISLLISCRRDAGSAKMALLVPKGIARYPDTGDSVKVRIIRVRFQATFCRQPMDTISPVAVDIAT